MQSYFSSLKNDMQCYLNKTDNPFTEIFAEFFAKNCPYIAISFHTSVEKYSLEQDIEFSNKKISTLN